jgi:predicted RNA-binding Zn ribbon-like protein
MTKQHSAREWQFDLSGGELCLDFANTVSNRGAPDRSRDHLQKYEDLIFFAQDSRLLSAQLAGKLHGISQSKPDESERVWGTAIVLREAIYRVFAGAARSNAAKASDVKTIEEFATEAMKHRELCFSRREFHWEWKHDEKDPLSFILWPIAQSAADLLTSERVKKVRICEASSCAWLFLDESRNHSRRWCDMKVCGNREKAKRHYERGRKTAASS